MGVDYTKTRPAVQQAALGLRSRHGALDWAASIDDLIVCEGLAQQRFSFMSATLPFKGLRTALSQTAKKVKALVSVKEKVILIAHDLPDTKTPFAKGHELGHSTLSWHREILYVCDEHDLSQKTRDQMEWEANYFSSEVLLPPPLIDKVYGAYQTSMQTVLLLSDWSRASKEACAIKYVERHPHCCVLLVMDNAADDQGNPCLKLTRKTLSRTGVRKFGQLKIGQTFGVGHSLYDDSRNTGIAETKINYGSNTYSVSLFNNSYRVLGIIHAP